jgi:hypothetical protein
LTAWKRVESEELTAGKTVVPRAFQKAAVMASRRAYPQVATTVLSMVAWMAG